jgi:hypothetical protein
MNKRTPKTNLNSLNKNKDKATKHEEDEKAQQKIK